MIEQCVRIICDKCNKEIHQHHDYDVVDGYSVIGNIHATTGKHLDSRDGNTIALDVPKYPKMDASSHNGLPVMDEYDFKFTKPLDMRGVNGGFVGNNLVKFRTEWGDIITVNRINHYHPHCLLKVIHFSTDYFGEADI